MDYRSLLKERNACRFVYLFRLRVYVRGMSAARCILSLTKSSL